MKYLIVVDMQVDFITGSLGSKLAEKIVPNVAEKVKNFDGKIIGKDANILGRVLSGELAIDLGNKILGKIYKIGATILGNDGEYKGRITPDGRVVNTAGTNIGYIKNNGSYINLDKNVAGYVLGEVAKNRRN